MTIKAFPTPKLQYTNFVLGVPNNSTQKRSFLAWAVGQIPSMMDAGLSGYDFFSAQNAAPVPLPGVPQNLAGFAGSLALVNREEGALLAELTKLEDAAKAKFGDEAALLSLDVTYFDSWMEWFDVYFDDGTAGAGVVLKSRLIDARAFTEDPEAIADALLSASEPNQGMSIYLLGGKGVNEAQPRGGSNAVHPGWRKALAHSREYFEVEKVL